MKQLILIFFIAFLPTISVFSQNLTPLTVKMVYDFEVGDVFIYKQIGFLNATVRFDTLYERQNILRKQLFLPDSIRYFIKKETFYKSSPFKLIVSLDTLNIKNLDSLAVYRLKSIPQDSQVYTVDRFYILNNSNRKVNGRYLACKKCLDLEYGIYFGEGIGLVEEYSSYPQGKNLLYFKKGTETWGTPINFPTSLFTPSVFQAKISFSPNPTNSILNIETDTDFDKIQVTNLNGQVVLKENKTAQITLSNLPNGIYFMQLYSENVLKGVKKFVINH
jgi:Secretion system C-terminal sorting domain